MAAEAGNPYFRVGYNSLGAFATINHLHFQVPSAKQLEITSLPISNTPIGFAGLVAGAYSMAIEEFVYVYTQYDIEMAQIKRETIVFTRNHKIRMGVVAAVASLALLVFGGVGAVLGKTPVRRSCVRVLIGGWMAMAITFGLTKLIGSSGI
ncbi:Ccc1 family [Sesbania bispinosa]|nr:Ccc1 family [Sesbania bispinosa]